MERFELDEAGSFCWQTTGDALERTATALVLEGGWLLVDAVDTDGLDEALAGRPVLGVCQLLSRHNRDVQSLAGRLGVPVLVPSTLAGRGEPLDLPGVQERAILSVVGWDESALWLPEQRTLVCADALGTTGYFLARGGDAVGVHPLLRLRPPRGALGHLPVRRLAVGHGAPVRGENVGEQIDEALDRARRDLPRVAANALAMTLGDVVRRARSRV